MEYLAVFIAQNHSGSFRMYFVKFKKNDENDDSIELPSNFNLQVSRVNLLIY